MSGIYNFLYFTVNNTLVRIKLSNKTFFVRVCFKSKNLVQVLLSIFSLTEILNALETEAWFRKMSSCDSAVRV